MHLLLDEYRLLPCLADDRGGFSISDIDSFHNYLIDFQDFLNLSLDLSIGESDLIGGQLEILPGIEELLLLFHEDLVIFLLSLEFLPDILKLNLSPGYYFFEFLVPEGDLIAYELLMSELKE